MTNALWVAAGLLATTASAQVNVQMQVGIPLPQIVFTAPPPLVVVEPGVQVVEDYDDEVFFVDGWYWTRRDNSWFRTRQYNGTWAVVDRRHWHPKLMRYKYGQYKHWKRHHRDEHHGHMQGAPPPGGNVHGAHPVPGGKMKFKKH